MRQPRTIRQLALDPRVLRVYRDSDGLWVDLADGWKNTYDEPRGALHGIHEDRLSDALVRMPYVKPCDCDECTEAKRRTLIARPKYAE